MKAILAAATTANIKLPKKKPTENKNKMLKSQIIPLWFIQF
jgi:hypothetical protein